MPLASSRLICFVCAFLILAAGCQSKTSAGRIIVLGLDGLDPETVDLLMSEGKMPNFARLRQEGAYGRLISSKPLLSPIIWTTIATGKTCQFRWSITSTSPTARLAPTQ